jgi:NADH dehydrogenase/NADH:ubiquinone oxidoreductase subunit G
MPKLTIDGQETRAGKDETVLDAARALGIKIPTLCHHAPIAPYGACRVCLVEVTARGRTQLTASCTYPVTEGLVVVTDSERIRKARKIILGLMLARAPDAEKVKELAAEYGVSADSTDKTGKFLFERASKTEPTDCILCGLCVRVCNEFVGRKATNFSGRGTGRAVKTPFDRVSEPCIGCGACAYVCPTRAIEVEQAG